MRWIYKIFAQIFSIFGHDKVTETRIKDAYLDITVGWFFALFFLTAVMISLWWMHIHIHINREIFYVKMFK